MARPLFIISYYRFLTYNITDLRRALFIFALIFLASLQPVTGQTITYNHADILNIYNSNCYAESITYFPSIACAENISGAFNLLPVYNNLVYNTKYAKGFNDGPAWQGRGLNTTVSMGFSGIIGKLRYVINPIIQYSENQSFLITSPLESTEDFQYPFSNRIDYVTRFGNNPFVKIFPGQSEITFSTKPVTFSLSTQNMRWGPALYNPILMSTNAQGIPHFRIGTTKPWETTIGKFEGNAFWGILKDSEFFSSSSMRKNRYFSGITIGYQPSFFEGFSVGLNRILYTQLDFLTNFFYDGFILFSGFFADGKQVNVNGTLANDAYDQLISATFHWQNPQKDFQIYLEWGRGDFASGILDFLRQPDHNRVFTYGLWKEFEISPSKKLRLIYEHTSLATWQTSMVRSSGSIYVHRINPQGYTNNGQIIGAGIGPGSSGNVVDIGYFWGQNTLSFEYQRTRYNDDYFFTNFTSRGAPNPQDIEHQIGLRFEQLRGNISYQIGSFIGFRGNYYFDNSEDLINSHTNISLRYYF